MCPSRNTAKTFYLQKKHKENLTFESVILSIPGLNPLSANPTKWSNKLKQFVGNLPTSCLSVFDHFVILGLKGLKKYGIYHQL